jgi:hypothetical protein
MYLGCTFQTLNYSFVFLLHKIEKFSSYFVPLNRVALICENPLFNVRTARNTELLSVARIQRFSIVICRPVTGQRLGKHIPAATNTQATIG